MIEPLELLSLLEKYGSEHTSRSSALKTAIRRAIADHVLSPKDELPSTRKAASALGISRSLVIEVYDGLQAEGLIETRRGARARICTPQVLKETLPIRRSSIALSNRGRVLCQDHRMGFQIGSATAFAPGLPDPKLFPRDEWAVCLRRVARKDHRDIEHYDEYQGVPGLRRALAIHLKQSRGVSVSQEQVFVLPSIKSGIAMLADLIADPGDTVWVEDPGYIGASAIFASKGLCVRPLPFDLNHSSSVTHDKILFTTPSFQYRTGKRMTVERRHDLLTFAKARNTLVIEDEYNADFILDGSDKPTIFSLDRSSSVAILGSMSRCIMPGIRVAWLVVPQHLVEHVRRVQRGTGLSVNIQVQMALADFISSGHFTRQLRTVAKTYRARMLYLKNAMIETLGESIDLRLPDSGLQMNLYLDSSVDDLELERRLWKRGFHVVALSRSYLTQPQRGLMIGFANASERSAKTCAKAIREELN